MILLIFQRTTEVIQFSTLQSAKFLSLDQSQFLFAHWMQSEKLFGKGQKFWPLGLYEGQKTNKGQKTK